MGGRFAMFCDNAVLHYFPASPFCARCSVNLRDGKKIVFNAVLRDTTAAQDWINRTFPGIRVKIIVHS